VERALDLPVNLHGASLSIDSDGPGATARVAVAVADLAVASDVLVLGGDLGAGKTAFTKAFGAALGIAEHITSPTFTLVQRYDGGRLVLHHLDVYRLDHVDETIDLALPELFEDGSVVVIEWGDTILSVLPQNYLFVNFVFGDGDDERTIELSAVGSPWQARMRSLREALEGATSC